MHTPSDRPFSSPDQATEIDADLAPSSADATSVLSEGQRLGPYRIVRGLGEGGMGAVYLAEQLEPVQRPVALKLIRDQLRGSLAEAYFMVERQALARMDHPAIAKIYDAGTTPEGFPYLAMEWIDGPTLAEFCTRTALPLRNLLALFVRICRGVHHAHQKGVIHRDLKPGNVLIAQVDDQPFPKIIDFGVAIGSMHSGSDAGTPLMQKAGTRGYMSPEQISGAIREIDIRTDVYALGVMLLELLAPPTLLDNAVTLRMDNVSLHTAVLVSLGKNSRAHTEIVRGLMSIPLELRWVLAKAMQPERSARYDSAEALAADVERYLTHHPLRAVPVTNAYRMRTFAARHRGAIIAATAAALALIVGSAAAVYGMLQARDAAQRATVEAEKSRATSNFLTDVLSGVDPSQARDMDKTLLHLILDHAAERAKRELASQPEVLADIENTIGGAYTSLNEPKNAVEHEQRAYDLSVAHAGIDAPQTLLIQRELATAVFYAGKAKEACAMRASNYAASTRVLGANAGETLRSGLDIVECESEFGDNVAAERRVSQLIPMIAAAKGNDSKLMFDALKLRGYALDFMGRYTEAEPIYKDIIARSTAKWGAQDPKTLDALNNFAILYLESHRYAEAAKILEDMLPVCEKIYGPDHGFTLNIVSNLAGALRQQGTPEKIAASGPYYKRTLEGEEKKYGGDHINVIKARHNYANYLLDVGDVDQAIALQTQVLAAATQTLGADHNITGEAQFGLGKALLAAKRYPEAEQALQAAVVIKQKDFGVDHWRIDEYMAPLVDLYTAWDKPDQAREWRAKRAALKPKPANAS